MPRSNDNINLDGTPFDIEVRYCWVDRNGARISPVHRDILAAINYLVAFEDRKAQIERRAAKATEDNDYELKLIEHWDKELHIKEGRRRAQVERFSREMDKINEAKIKLTRTGEPPHALRRLVTSTVVQEIEDDEATMVTTSARMHNIEIGGSA